jgi:hypothetical protein
MAGKKSKKAARAKAVLKPKAPVRRRRRNPQDATLRNIRTTRKSVADAVERIEVLEEWLKAILGDLALLKGKT